MHPIEKKIEEEEKNLRKIVKKMIEIERDLYTREMPKISFNEEDIRKKIREIERKIRKIEMKISTSFLPQKIEKELCEKAGKLEREKEELIKMLREVRKARMERLEIISLKNSLKALYRSSKRKIREIFQLKKKLEMIKGITVYKEEPDKERIRKLAENFLEKIKKGGKISFEEFLAFQFFEEKQI